MPARSPGIADTASPTLTGDRATIVRRGVTSGPKPDLVADLDATYHHGGIEEAASALDPDILIEATRGGCDAGDRVVRRRLPDWRVAQGRSLSVEAGSINREIVLENDAIIGSVNANLGHYRDATASLARADMRWLESLVSRRVPLTDFADAFTAEEDDVKVAIALGDPEASAVDRG